MATLASFNWGSSPKIPLQFDYEYRRNGTSMEYNVTITIKPVNGSSSYGNNISASIWYDGVLMVDKKTLKANSPSQWSKNITYSTGWLSVANKLSGTTALKIYMFTTNGSTSRNAKYYYDMAVSAANPNFTTAPSVSRIDETSVSLYSGSTDISSAMYYSMDGGSWNYMDANTITVGGLGANTTHSFTIQARNIADQSLTCNYSAGSVITYSNPSVSGWPSNISLDSATKNITIWFNNPLRRSVTAKASIGGYSVSGSTTGDSVTLELNSDSIYAQIPSATSGAIAISAAGSSTNITATAVATYAKPTIKIAGFVWSAVHPTDIAKAFTSTSKMVQNKSSLKVSYSSQANIVTLNKSAASLKSVTVTFGGKAAQSLTTTAASYASGAVYNVTGDQTATVVVTDSRGFTDSAIVTIPFISYVKPTANISATREGGYGSKVTITGEGSYSSLEGTNAITKITYKAGSNGTETTLSDKSGTKSASTTVTLDTNSSQTYYVRVTDKTGNVSDWVSTFVNVGQPLVFIDDKCGGVGINSYPVTNGVEGKIHNAPVAIIGSDNDKTSGWYKVASGTCSGYGNLNATYLVKAGYSNGYIGILHIELRGDNGSMRVWQLKWLLRQGFAYNHAIIVVNGTNWTLYIYNSSIRYGRVYFTELSVRGIGGGEPGSYRPTYYNSGSPETSTPTATTTSSDAMSQSYPINSIYFSMVDTSPASIFGGTWEKLSGNNYLRLNGPNASGGSLTTGGSSAANTGGTTLTAAQSGLRNHGHGASGSYSGANFYVRHGKNSGTATVAAGDWTSVQEGVGAVWGNGFSTQDYNHAIDRVNIGGSVSVSVNDSGSSDASEAHSHSMAHTHPFEPTYTRIYAWKRTA